MKMENAEEIFHFLEEFSKRKPKTIPQELNDYLAYVARTGDPVYQWALVKALFKEKLLNVITEFYETTPGIDIPPYPNVDPFNYDTMKNSLLERLDTFNSAPFTVQRICELLTYPRKQYNRVDKFMRAIEKNILVVSTREPGIQRHIEAENGEPMEPVVNGSDNNSEYNVDVEMEDMSSWKDSSEPQQSSEPQPSSSDTHISVDDIEARLKAKEDTIMDTQEKVTAQYESVTPPELNVTTDELPNETKAIDESSNQQPATSPPEETKPDSETVSEVSDSTEKPKDVEMSTESPPAQALVIPEIKVEDAEMTEQKLIEQASVEEKLATTEPAEKEPIVESQSDTNDSKPVSVSDDQQIVTDESSSDSNTKEEIDNKLSEVQTSSEESSSSSDNTDGNSNSPKTVESNTDNQEESSMSDSNMEETKEEEVKQSEPEEKEAEKETPVESPQITKIETDNYSISDVKSELPQPQADTVKAEETPSTDEKEAEVEKEPEPQKEITEESNDSNKTETEIPADNPSS